MFNKIESLYKKECSYNRILKKLAILHFIIIAVLWLLCINNLVVLMVLTVLSTSIIITLIIKKELNVNIVNYYLKKRNRDLTIEDQVLIKDKATIKELLKEEKLFNKETIRCIMDHYRTYTKGSIITNNIWSILAITIPITLCFITDKGFNVDVFAKNILFIICSAIIVLLLFLLIKQFTNMTIALKGEDGIYERLELIFSELYIELNQNCDTTKIIESEGKNNSVLVNFVIKSGDYNSKGLDDTPIEYKLTEKYDGNIKMNELLDYLAAKYMQPTLANIRNPYYYCINYWSTLWAEYFDIKKGLICEGISIKDEETFNIELWKLDKQFNLSNKTIELVICGPGIGGGVGDSEGIHFFFHTNEKERHNQSHIHCSYSGEEIRVDLETLTIMKPCKSFKNKKKTKKALELIKLNQKELINYWNKVVKNGEYLKFEMVYEPQKDT